MSCQSALLVAGVLWPLAAADPPARSAPSPLARLASEMPPGTWAELKTEGLDSSVLKAPAPSKGLDLMGWSDDAHWDSKTGQFLFMGLRQMRQMMVYRQADNRWRAISLPEDHAAAGSPPRASQFGHIYSRNALDPERSQFYHMDHHQGGGIYRFDLASETWAKLPAQGSYSMTGVIEYFSARKSLLFVGDSTDTRHNQLQAFDTENQSWSNLGPIAVHGYHSLGRHNPFRQEVLLAGGNNSPLTMVRVTRDGRIERLKDFPAEVEMLSIARDKITVDPRSGKYLVLCYQHKRFYEYDSQTQQARLLDDFTQTPWPFHHYDHPVVAFVPEHGVTMWAANSRVMLYKHRADK
jgi:hypothetical protein